jgi:putative GTP pyrophosphokinase
LYNYAAAALIWLVPYIHTLSVEQKPVISQEEFRQQYNQRKPQYERLAANLQQALRAFLEEKSISYLEVLARVKDVDSAYEKIARKDYDSPFEQIEDWCGLRIICYYPSDIDRICEVLKDEFAVHTQEDTAQRLASNEFGYRSIHFILQVKSTWAVTPNYRGLQDFKAEVQVRTILMHAWAEIEHKLAYKSTEQAPDQFRRKLSWLSAKLEEADAQFEELRSGISAYRKTIYETVTNVSAFRSQKFNLDTLQAFLDVAFPNRKVRPKDVSNLIDELLRLKMNLKQLVHAWENTKKTIDRLQEKELKRIRTLSQVGLARLMLDVTYEEYYKSRHNYVETGSISERFNPWAKLVIAVRAAVKESAQENPG